MYLKDMSEILKNNDIQKEAKKSPTTKEDILKVSETSNKIKKITQKAEQEKKKDEKEADKFLENALWENKDISKKEQINNGDIDNKEKLAQISQKIKVLESKIENAQKNIDSLSDKEFEVLISIQKELQNLKRCYKK